MFINFVAVNEKVINLNSLAGNSQVRLAFIVTNRNQNNLYLDDIEFFHSAGEGLLHYRSASRVGYSDMGQNRKRLKDFLERLANMR